MALNFEVAGGSVAGSDHRKGVPKNRQDAYYTDASESLILAAVADGCGSGTHSEVGAAIGVRLLVNYLRRYLAHKPNCSPEILEAVRQEMLAHLDWTARNMGASKSEVVSNYFLFTLLGAAITETEAVFFALGDGIVVVNGWLSQLEPENGNEPLYLGYGLTGSRLTDEDPSKLRFRTIRRLPTADLAHFLIGSDGVKDISARAFELMPGSDESIGTLDQFWSENKYFSRVGIERKLNLIARSWPRRLPDGEHVIEGGKLPDDATLVAGRNIDHPAYKS